MKKSNQNKTIRKNRKLSQSSTLSYSDLITRSQSMLSSQNASIRSKNISKTQSYDQQENFTIQDLIQQENSSTVVITQQQESVIQQILQIARKGKISPNNAFQIPIKVLDPSKFNTSRTKFWKFASDLLNASMGIYDKRVESISLRTQKMFGGLSRIYSDDKDLSQQQAQQLEDQRKRQNKNLLLQIKIQDITSSNSLDQIDVGQQMLEKPQRLNIQKPQKQFIPDPLFSRKLKTFDQSKARCLILNAFGLDQKLHVQLVNDNSSTNNQINNNEEKPKLQIQTNYEQNIFFSTIQADKNPCLQLQQQRQQNNSVKIEEKQPQSIFMKSYWGNISQKWKKAQVIANNTNFQNKFVEFFNKEISKKQQQKKIKQKKGKIRFDAEQLNNFQQRFGMEFFVPQIKILQPNDNYYQTAQTAQQPVEAIQPLTCWSENMCMTKTSEFWMDTIVFTQQQQQNRTVVAPWQFQFKNNQLRRKRKNTQRKPTQKNNKQPIKNELDLFSAAQQQQSREAVLKVKKIANSAFKHYQSQQEQNLLIRSLSPYDDFYVSRAQEKSGHQYSEQDRQTIEQISFMNHNNLYEDNLPQVQQILEIENDTENEQAETGKQSKQGKQSNLKIKQLKKYIRDIVDTKNQVSIFDLQISQNVSPASIFLTMLHVANEGKYKCSTEDDCNIILSNFQQSG